MNKKAMERSHQDGMRPVQEAFTENPLDNYEGVSGSGTILDGLPPNGGHFSPNVSFL